MAKKLTVRAPFGVADQVKAMRAARRRALVEAGLLGALRSRTIPDKRREASRRACRGAIPAEE